MLQSIETVLPVGESDKVLSPAGFASEILNFYEDREGVLRAISGVAPYVPDYGDGYPSYGRIYGGYHTVVENGTRDILLVRAGDKLLSQAGWNRGWEEVADGLCDDPNQKFPDCFFEFNGRVVWSNGIDAPRVYDGYRLLPLGFDHPPGAPSARGPRPSPDPVYRNFDGYSHNGRIGTIGDALQGQDGALLAGSWQYYVQFEDANGARSPLSAASPAVLLATEQTASVATNPKDKWFRDISGNDLKWLSVTLDDLTKQFLVADIDTGPEGTVARLIYRTRDMQRNPAIPYLLTRLEDNASRVYPDNVPDSSLGEPARPAMVMPAFKVGAVHQGRMVIGNTSANPSIVHISEAGNSTLPESGWCLVGDGPDVTGIISFEGECYVFTRTSTYKLIISGDTVNSVLVHASIGCVAPRSICATGWGTVVWLGADGLYEMRGGQIQPANPLKSADTFKIASADPAFSCAVYDKDAREYVLFYPRAGARGCDNALAYNGVSYRRRDYGVVFTSVFTTRDERGLILGGGVPTSGTAADRNFFVLNREVYSYAAPARAYRYRSSWVGVDPMHRKRFTLSTLYLGFVEYEGASATVNVYSNGRKVASPAWSKTFMVRPDDWLAPTGTPLAGNMGSLVIGTDRVYKPKVFWVRLDVNVRSVTNISWEIESAGKIAMVGWCADVALVDSGPRTRQV